ncbi:MAG TPA: hypothetical protein VF598_09390 [Hymenobacter sp.]|jgi:hypothetical protein
MPKTIDYPRTSYASAWEVAEVVDDTGGKCAIETCARKLSRKVSGSFKAIIGSAVKFGLLTSKRELLTTTNLFRRIKHAYDKQEEKIFHREAFLNPPLFTQICRKFRSRELPVHMFDVILIREFGVEEINAQNVAKAFVDGARMVGVLDERNVIADIDQLAAQQSPRRELASTEMPLNVFRASASPTAPSQPSLAAPASTAPISKKTDEGFMPPLRGRDAVSSLFGLDTDDLESDSSPDETLEAPQSPTTNVSDKSSTVSDATMPLPTTPNRLSTPTPTIDVVPTNTSPLNHATNILPPRNTTASAAYSVHISGPGIDSSLVIQDAYDLDIVNILLEKIRKQLK